MTDPGPAAPQDRPQRPAPSEFSEAEKLAAQWEARHDVAARGHHADPAAVQHYLAHARSEEGHRHGGGHGASAAHRAGGPAPAPPVPPGGTSGQGVRRPWWRRLLGGGGG